MSNTEIKPSETTPTNPSVDVEVNGVPLITRRRLFKAGLTATPVVMTLASRPVLAWHCTAPSAWGSINRSRKVTCTTVEYYTCTVKQWKDCSSQGWCYNDRSQKINWPSACGSRTSLTMAQCGLGTSNAKVKDRLASSSDSFELCSIAAYLNCKAGWVDKIICLDTTKVKKMYNDCKSGGYHTVSAGVKWYQVDVIRYYDQNWITAVNSFSGNWSAKPCK